MSEGESKIELGQVEESDIPLLREFLNSNFAQYLGMHEYLSTYDLSEGLKKAHSSNTTYIFTIKVQAPGDFKKIVRGFAALTHIDWIARNAKLSFIKVDSKGNLKTIKDSNEALKAYVLCLDYAFDSLNLHKVWVEVFEGHNITSALSSLGFVAEGVRKKCAYLNGSLVSSTICSLLSSEREHK